MGGTILIVLIVLVVAVRIGLRVNRAKTKDQKPKKTTPLKPLTSPWQRKLYTVYIFAKLNTRRFFRDRLAIFFGVLFPLIFLFVFGALNHSGTVSFHVALINDSSTAYANQFAKQINDSKLFKVNQNISTFSEATDQMNKSEIDGTIVLPASFGASQNGHPGGQVKIYYTPNSDQAGQALTSVVQQMLSGENDKYGKISQPYTADGIQTQQKSLTAFDYTFSGLLGFSIVGAGIFGPINVFPELKKQGILRRFHTTPLRVWQYFISTMISQAITGLVAIAVMFVAAITVFHLHVVGNYLEIALFIALGIVLILGIGLALGGWAKNERQAAPLGNIIVFPMIFLSGVFFPRFLMPDWLQNITNYIPLSPVIDGARQLITEGKGLTDLGSQLAIMGVWMIIIYVIAFRVFRWE